MAIRMTRKLYLALINRKPSKGYVALRKRKRVKDVAGYIADAKWSAEVKVRAGGKCEWDKRLKIIPYDDEKTDTPIPCPKRPWAKGLTSHHIFSRSLKSVRSYPPNGACLCAGHHFNAHKYSSQFRDMMIAKRGAAWWADLQAKANTRHAIFTGPTGSMDEIKGEA